MRFPLLFYSLYPKHYRNVNFSPPLSYTYTFYLITWNSSASSKRFHYGRFLQDGTLRQQRFWFCHLPDGTVNVGCCLVMVPPNIYYYVLICAYYPVRHTWFVVTPHLPRLLHWFCLPHPVAAPYMPSALLLVLLVEPFYLRSVVPIL